MAFDSPPAYAWDWLARQRVAWREIRNRLLASEGSPAPAHTPVAIVTSDSKGSAAVGDVPDWSADHRDALQASTHRAAVPSPSPQPAATAGDAPVRHHYDSLDTRAEVLSALRVDYSADAGVRRTVDAVVTEIAFLGRLDVPLNELGVRSAPRGMRWWWCHLGGSALDDGRGGTGDADDPRATLPTQLRLVDVLSGYGDAPDV